MIFVNGITENSTHEELEEEVVRLSRHYKETPFIMANSDSRSLV